MQQQLLQPEGRDRAASWRICWPLAKWFRLGRCCTLMVCLSVGVCIWGHGRVQYVAWGFLEVLFCFWLAWILVIALALFIPPLQREMVYLHRVRSCWVDRNVEDRSTCATTRHLLAPYSRNVELPIKEGGLAIPSWHMAPSDLSSELETLTAAARNDRLDSALLDPDAKVVLWLHGQGKDRTQNSRVRRYRKFAEKIQAHVLAIEYRGFGETVGQFTPTHHSLIEDAMTGFEWLREKTRQKNDIVIFGQSLGCAVAVQLAARLERENIPYNSLILDVPFKNTVDAMQFHPAATPLQFLPGGQALANICLSDSCRWDSDLIIGDLNRPLLTISGGADNLVGPRAAGQLCDIAAEAKPKRICRHVHIDQANHANTFTFSSWLHAVTAFTYGDEQQMCRVE